LNNEELEDLLNSLPEQSDNILEYFQMLDREIPTEETLTEEQIVNLVQSDGKDESKNDDDDDVSDDDDDVIPPISAKEATSMLEKFINYFEQQKDNSDFNIDDLRVFKKYLRVTRAKAFNSKYQCVLDTFFKDK
jgi:hypothetical protein